MRCPNVEGMLGNYDVDCKAECMGGDRRAVVS